MGTVFGSFFTLAVYRIPLKKDITHERSFCPTCGHKLGFWDMIPILSYIFARGKCRYCGEKIRIRYLVLEALSGTVFLLEYIALNMHFPYLSTSKIAFYISFVFMYVTIALIAGIDKENRNINKGILIFGFIMQGLYILYLYIVNQFSMYRYGMYFCIMIILYIIDTVSKRKSKESNYILQVFMLCSYIGACMGTKILVIVCALGAITTILDKFLKKEPKIGFLLGVFTVILAIIQTFLIYF